MSPTAQEVVEEDPELPAVSLARKLLAEAIGTFVLVFGGVGTMVFAGHRVGDLGVALAFGFTLLFLMYAIGPISGCHVNPAVTLGRLLLGRIGVIAAVDYVVAQVLGGVAAGGVIYAIARDLPSYDRVHDGLGANGWGAHSPARLDIVGPLGGLAENGYGLTAAATIEILLTALLVFVVLASTDRLAHVPLAGVSVGITLTVIHLISLPIDATSVNPVRSLAVAPYQDGAMSQLWAFLVFPLVGSAIGALAYALLFSRARPPVQ